MKEYDKKFGFSSESKEVKDFHSNRIMFAIKDNKIYKGPANSTMMHSEWFEQLGWMDKNNDKVMYTLTRGFVDSRGIFFYSGYDFSVRKEDESEIILHLLKLKEIFTLNDNTQVFGGVIKQSQPGTWPPRQSYGTIKEIIEKVNNK